MVVSPVLAARDSVVGVVSWAVPTIPDAHPPRGMLQVESTTHDTPPSLENEWLSKIGVLPWDPTKQQDLV